MYIAYPTITARNYVLYIYFIYYYQKWLLHLSEIFWYANSKQENVYCSSASRNEERFKSFVILTMNMKQEWN